MTRAMCYTRIAPRVRDARFMAVWRVLLRGVDGFSLNGGAIEIRLFVRVYYRVFVTRENEEGTTGGYTRG